MIQNIIFGVYLLILDFLAESLKVSKNWENITHFTIQFDSESLAYNFTILNTLNIVKNILLQHSQTPSHFTKFPGNIFLVGVRGNICTAPFLEAQELHFRSTGKANNCIFQ